MPASSKMILSTVSAWSLFHRLRKSPIVGEVYNRWKIPFRWLRLKSLELWTTLCQILQCSMYTAAPPLLGTWCSSGLRSQPDQPLVSSCHILSSLRWWVGQAKTLKTKYVENQTSNINIEYWNSNSKHGTWNIKPRSTTTTLWTQLPTATTNPWPNPEQFRSLMVHQPMLLCLG